MVRTIITKSPLYLLLAGLMCLTTGMNAQTRKAEKQDNLQQQKIAFFNENLKLTAAESSRFWPVYNDYQNRRDKITNDRNSLLKYYESNRNNLTETETSDLIKRYVGFQQEETRLLETYTRKFQEFLPAIKVMRIFSAELEFKKWLLQNLRDNKAALPSRN
jgi:hypothetical protein